MVILGLSNPSRSCKMDLVSGGTPYGDSTPADAGGSRHPSENELAIARTRGGHVALVAAKLAA